MLLSRNEAYAVRELITVAPVTTRIRQIPTEVPLGSEEGLPKRCVVNLDTITTIPKAALTDRISTLAVEKMAEVERALRFALGLRPRLIIVRPQPAGASGLHTIIADIEQV